MDYNAECAHAAADPAAFWAEKARAVEWAAPWHAVRRFEPPAHAWFEGGRRNAMASCVDRHAKGEPRTKAALIWLSEDGEERTCTYGRLYREVNRFADALASLGVTEGGRVVISMPNTPEGVTAMLACARLGAIHSVVYAGMGAGALRARIEDAGAYVVVKPGQGAGPGLVASLEDHVRQDLGPVAQPSEIEVRASLPKARSGKIVRRMLKAEAIGMDPGDVSTLAGRTRFRRYVAGFRFLQPWP